MSAANICLQELQPKALVMVLGQYFLILHTVYIYIYMFFDWV